MKFFENFDRKKWLYNGLIITFIILYAATAFVSFYHAITFFHIANAIWLSVLLSFVAEIGQASVLFSILLTDNKNKFLPWIVMLLLTTLQIIGNVVSSFDWIIDHNDAGLDGFKRSILFFVQAENTEMFRVIVAWISGALLPVIALSMTALVAQNIDLREKEKEKHKTESKSEEDSVEAKDIISEVSKIRPTEEDIKKLHDFLTFHTKPKTKEEVINEIIKEETEINKEEPVVQDTGQDTGQDNEEPEEDIEPDEDEFGPVDLTDVEPDILPDYRIKTNNGLAEDIEIKPQIIESVFSAATRKTDDIPDKTIEETPPIIEPEKKIQETPEPVKNHIPPQLQHLTQEQLERIRQIAKDNLKKK